MSPCIAMKCYCFKRRKYAYIVLFAIFCVATYTSIRKRNVSDVEKIEAADSSVVRPNDIINSSQAINNSFNTLTDAGFIDLGGSVKVPNTFLSDYKNPCWYDPTDRRNLKCIPYFFLIGVAKCGTTDIFFSLKKHPHVLKTAKEPHWFSWLLLNSTSRGQQPLNWTFESYLQVYENATKDIEGITIPIEANHIHHPAIIGDFSANTAYDWKWTLTNSLAIEGKLPYHNSAELIYMINNKTKIMVSLRNPIDRLYSAFHVTHFQKTTPSGFHEAAVKTIGFWNDCIATKSPMHCLTQNPDWTRYVRISVSIYYIFLREWLKVFPREQILVIKFEEYSRNRSSVMNSILNFLDLEPMEVKYTEQIMHMYIKNRAHKEKMLPETRSLLREFFKPYNAKLAELLQDDYFNYYE